MARDPALVGFLIVVLAASVLAGCRDGTGGAEGHNTEAGPNRTLAAGDTSGARSAVTVTDRLGRTESFTSSPQRIVSLSPSITEVLFGIGAGDRLVGATKYCDYPSAANQIPRVGGGTMESLNQEMIVALQPDLVLCKWDSHQPLLRNLERLGISVLALGPENLAQLYEETRLLGQITGHSPQAEALIQSMQQRVAAIVERVPEGDGPKVFYQVWDEPLMTAGRDSFIGELLGLAGARNVFAESRIAYPKVNPEVVVAGDPDVILAPGSHGAPVSVESILSRPGWSDVRAIRKKRVYVLDRDTISRCGPRLVDALEEIVGVLYPEQSESWGRVEPESDAGGVEL